MVRFGNSISRILTLMFALLAAGLALSLVVGMAEAIKDTRAARRIGELSTLDQKLFQTMQDTRLVRGLIPTAVLTTDDPRPEVNRILDPLGPGVESALAAARQIDMPELAPLIQAAADRWANTQRRRADFDPLMAKPKAERNIRDTAAWSDALGESVDALAAISRALGNAVRMADPIAAENAAISRAAYATREASGAECIMMRSPVLRGELAPPAVQANLFRARGIAAGSWEQLRGLVDRPNIDPRLPPAVAKGQEAFRTTIAAQDAMYQKLDGSGKPIATPADYSKQCNAPFDAEMAIVSLALELNIAHARDAMAAADRTLAIEAAATLLAIGIAIAGFMVVRRRVARPIQSLTRSIEILAKGDYDQPVRAAGRNDELTRMAEVLDMLRSNAAEAQQMADAQAEAQAAELARAGSIDRLCHSFDDAMATSLETVDTGIGAMSRAADRMGQTTAETNEKAVAITAAAEQSAQNIDTVASAVTEMKASISEIAQKVEQSVAIARQTVSDTEESKQDIANLTAAAAEIGNVVSVISAIASQTNLLALNATIEAARAGEAGKGFAVVASEVKALANQTAQATDLIAQQVAAIQSATSASTARMETIGDRIRSVDEIAAMIAGAVEEQDAAMSQIARDAEEVSGMTRTVVEQIGGVREAVEQSGRAAHAVRSTMTALSTEAGNLKREVVSFIRGVKAA